MSAERINELHEKASECYLSGDFRGALQAWRDVLGLDPQNEQALGGVRLASQFVEPEAPTFAAPRAEVESELERSLKVFDGLGAATLLHADPADGATDRKPEPESDEMLAMGEVLEGWEAPAAPPDDAGSFGLDPVSPPSPPPEAPVSGAASELKRRVDDLLAEAKAKAEAGERDEALSILVRLSILDEENAEAGALRAKLEADGASDLDKVERAIIEGVAALEAGELDEAERHLHEALAIVPDHREARQYLEKIAERRLSGGEDLLAPKGGEAPPADDAVQRAIGIASPARARSSEAKEAPAESPVRPPAAVRSRFALPSRKTLIVGGLGAAILACVGVALPRLFHGSAAKKPSPSAAEPLSRAKRPAKPGTAAKGAGAAASAVPNTPEDHARAAATSLASGESLMAAGDFGGAVVAFNQALTFDPENAAAKQGIADAGERYKAGRAQRDAIESIKLAFRDGEFSSGLRVAYRLPPGVDKSYSDGVKVAGWYNLAVVALRAGDCREAQSRLDEALEIAPSDAEAKRLRELASRYADTVKDRAFLARVEALAFRPLPPS